MKLKRRLVLRRFFEMPEARVHNLFDAEEFGSQQVSQIEQSLLGAFVHLCKSLIHAPIQIHKPLVHLHKPLVHTLLKIGEALVIEKDADQNG
ncbi:MAG: hypothetical protein ABSB15_21010 [Bryobacteraceae bacterium]|jgi:hypothetical protein